MRKKFVATKMSFKNTAAEGVNVSHLCEEKLKRKRRRKTMPNPFEMQRRIILCEIRHSYHPRT